MVSSVPQTQFQFSVVVFLSDQYSVFSFTYYWCQVQGSQSIAWLRMTLMHILPLKYSLWMTESGRFYFGFCFFLCARMSALVIYVSMYQFQDLVCDLSLGSSIRLSMMLYRLKFWKLCFHFLFDQTQCPIFGSVPSVGSSIRLSVSTNRLNSMTFHFLIFEIILFL